MYEVVKIVRLADWQIKCFYNLNYLVQFYIAPVYSVEHSQQPMKSSPLSLIIINHNNNNNIINYNNYKHPIIDV